MATALRFDEGMKRFSQYGLKECMVSHVEHLAVNIYIGEEYAGWIDPDGRVTIGHVRVVPQLITFTETQWVAIAFRAKEFKERCARIAQEQEEEARGQAEAAETSGALCAG